MEIGEKGLCEGVGERERGLGFTKGLARALRQFALEVAAKRAFDSGDISAGATKMKVVGGPITKAELKAQMKEIAYSGAGAETNEQAQKNYEAFVDRQVKHIQKRLEPIRAKYQVAIVRHAPKEELDYISKEYDEIAEDIVQ